MKSINLDYLLFAYLWIIILVPKSVQMIILFGILALFLLKSKFKIKLNKAVIFLLGYILINFVSIVVNSFKTNELQRILAALNTCFIWLVASLMFCYYRQVTIDKEKIKKYLVINIYILIALALITIIMDKLNLKSPYLLSRNLYQYEWLSNKEKLRFFGFMEYSNLVDFFYLLCFPFAFEYIKNKHKKLYVVIFTILSAIPVIMTNSRLGIFLIIVVVASSLYDISTNNKRTKKMMIVFLIICILSISLIFNQDIIQKIKEIIYSRQGSTSMRNAIYSLSLEKTLHNSILIGNGIKEIYNGYPLGSHSTFLGIFYKTGIIGSIFAIIGLILMQINTFISLKNKNKSIVYIICLLCVLCFLIIEDLDGANWLIVLYFSLLGIICNNNIIIKNQNEKRRK